MPALSLRGGVILNDKSGPADGCLPADAQEIPVPENLAGILTAGQKYLAAMGPGYLLYAEQLAGLEQRLFEGRFHLAVLGQVKRGKSTLINALLGEDVLPSSVVPLTAIPTFIRYGREKGIRVRYNDSRPDTVFSGEPAPGLNKLLRGFVTEEENPENQKGVREVEISHPAAILRDVVLIDTPGIGSTYRHNTEATMNFLPQCDAALFLVSADPPITEVEVAFLKEIKNRVAKLFFVLNKVDYLNEAERETVLAFYRTVLARDPGTRIFPVSARKGLTAGASDNSPAWQESGLADVFDHLIAFLACEKNRVLREAIGKKARDLFCDAGLRINLERRALELPLAELEARLIRFDEKIREAEQQRLHAQDILAGDRRRMHERLEAHINDLRGPLFRQLADIGNAAIASSPQNPECAAQQAVSDAIPAWFERELGQISAMMEEEMAASLKAHGKWAGALVESIRKDAAELFDIPHHAPEEEQVYRQVRKPYWVDHEWECSFSLIPSAVIGRILPGSLRKRRARDRLEKQIDVLMMRNLENLRYETLQNIDTGFLKFSRDLDSDLRMTIDATHGAIRSALARRKHCAEESADRLCQVKKAAAEMQEVIRQFEAAKKRS